MYSKQFAEAMDIAFPGWRKYKNSSMLDRFMDDNTKNGIPYQEVLAASSLGELKSRASRIKMQHDLHHALRTGGCYEGKEEARKNLGCPRIYAQNASDDAALEAFICPGVFYIPDCPKFASGECWKRFDELGFTMK